MNFYKMRIAQAVFTLVLLLVLAVSVIGSARAQGDVGVNSQLLVDGWYGDDNANGLLLQEAQVIEDGEVVSIVVALAFLPNPDGDEQLVFISQPIQHNAFFGTTDAAFRQVPNGETYNGFMVGFPQLQPSPTQFNSIIEQVRILIDDVPTGFDDDGNVILTSFNLVLPRLP